MTFHVNHPILFILAGVIIAAVLGQSVYFLVKALKRGRQLGMDQAKIKKTIKTAAIFTIAPAVSIVISVITLSKDLGLAMKKWKWLGDYALPISLIAGMASAIPITAWLG